MKVVVAMDSFKACMSSMEAATQVAKGIHLYDRQIEVQKVFVSDGGEGSLESYLYNCQGTQILVETFDAYHKKIVAPFGLIDNQKTAIIEVAKVIGVQQYPREKRFPLQASSYGVGKLMLHAKNCGVNKIVICLGGTCTNDVGMGLLSAIGVKFYDKNHQRLQSNAYNLRQIDYINFKNMERFEGIELIVASDVTNYLLGNKGATYTFGRQKGFLSHQLPQMEKNVQHFASKISEFYHVNLNDIEAGGAGGGICSALVGILKAKRVSGISLLLQEIQFHEKIKEADLVITGEGQSDLQTKYGKVPVGILAECQKSNIPVICLSGALGKGYQKLYENGFIGIFSIADRAMSFAQAIEEAPQKLCMASYNLIRLIDYLFKGGK